MTSFEQAEVAYPVWSPDGRRIGFTANPEGAYQAYVIQAEGGQPQKIEALGNNVYGWTWSRNGQWIFPSSTGGIQQIWKVAASGGIPRQITQHGAGGGTCAESPDGTLLFYTRPGGVWSVPLNGGAEHQVFRFDVDQGWVQATSSGIYFITNSTVTKPGDLMFYRFPHGPITKIAGVQTRYGFSVSPDARWLVYTRMTSTGSDLMLAENFR
jgi:Tol biopolymer transport system component